MISIVEREKFIRLKQGNLWVTVRRDPKPMKGEDPSKNTIFWYECRENGFDGLYPACFYLHNNSVVHTHPAILTLTILGCAWTTCALPWSDIVAWWISGAAYSRLFCACILVNFVVRFGIIYEIIAFWFFNSVSVTQQSNAVHTMFPLALPYGGFPKVKF